MAAPDIKFKFNSSTEASPTWTDIGLTDKITFTGAGSSAGDLKPIPRPTTNKVRIADEVWIDTTVDVEITQYDGGGQEVNSFTTDIFPTDPTNTNVFAIQADTNPEAQPGELELWDDTNFNTTAKETIAGTTNLGAHSQVRAAQTGSNVTPASGAGTMPGTYQSQTAQTTTHQLKGNTEKIVFTTALAAGNQNRFVLHLFVVDDSGAGLDTVELTYRFFFT
jgi:hypothetical protein